MITLDLSVEAGDWESLGDVAAIAERAAGAAGAVIPAAALPPEGGECAVLFTDDAAMRALNRTWRDQDKPTNVLSFPGGDHPGGPGPRHLGDIVLAYETVAREAAEEGKPPAEHVSHLIVHGILHCLGYDHESDAQAEEMEALEIAALKEIGIADPYADHAA